MLTHLNLAVQTQTLIRYWRLYREDEINLCGSPMSTSAQSAASHR